MRRTISAIIWLGLAGMASAQTPRWEISAQVGTGNARMRGNEWADGSDPIHAATWGLSVQLDVDDRYSLRVGAFQQLKGMEQRILFTDPNGSPIGEGDLRTELSYLVIPCMVRRSFGQHARAYVSLGPYTGILFKATRVFSGLGYDGEYDSAEDHETWDAGLCASIGGAFPLGDRIRLNAEVRYDHGLKNISSVALPDEGKLFTRSVNLLIGLGYRFGQPR